MFPNQDTMPKGASGSIALPCRRRAKEDDSVLSMPISSRIPILGVFASVEQLSPERVASLSKALDTEGELG